MLLLPAGVLSHFIFPRPYIFLLSSPTPYPFPLREHIPIYLLLFNHQAHLSFTSSCQIDNLLLNIVGITCSIKLGSGEKCHDHQITLASLFSLSPALIPNSAVHR